MSVAAIVLAAGSSHRLGRPKQNIVLNGETLLDRTIRAAREASLYPIIVVVRAAPEPRDSQDPQAAVMFAVNHDADEGLASSIGCGIRLALNHNVAGAVLLACDQPALRADHIRALMQDEHRVTGSAYAGSIGVPAFFPASSFPSLLQLRGDAGARKLLVNEHSIRAENLRLDIDTEEDLSVARSLLEPSEK